MVEGTDQSPLPCSAGTPEIYGPLMSLNGDDIVEASLMEPTGEELQNLPHPRGGSHALLGEELQPPEAPETAAFLPGMSRNLKAHEQPTEQINAVSTPAPSSPTIQNPAATLPRKQRNAWQGIESNLDITIALESGPTLRRTGRGTQLVEGILVHLPLQGF